MQRHSAGRSVRARSSLQAPVSLGRGLRLISQATTGACSVEYGLTIGLLSAVCAAASAAFGRSVAQCFAELHFGQYQQAMGVVGGF